MTYAELVETIQNLTDREREFSVQVQVGDQYLTIQGLDRGDGDDPPVIQAIE